MLKILIIEDRRENIVFIANNILKPMGYDIITAMDGQTGLNKAQEEDPDLIITDLKLPKLGGLEILEKLVEAGVNIPSIVMTFHGTEETAVRALRLGARDYLIKPFTIEEMHAALERALTAVPPARRSTPGSEDGSRVIQLEKKLADMLTVLAERESQLEQMRKQLTNTVDKVNVAEIAQRAAAWEEDNARLNRILAQAKERLNKAEARASTIENVVATQRIQMGKYQQETRRLANELRNLSEAMRLMAQDMSQQIERLSVLIASDKS